jgi:hypothetical protein
VSALTIVQLRARKLALEDELRALLADRLEAFREETGMPVYSLEVQVLQHNRIGEPYARPLLSGVKIGLGDI